MRYDIEHLVKCASHRTQLALGTQIHAHVIGAAFNLAYRLF